MYYFHLQFKQPDVLVLMCDFKSISQVSQHSSPFSVQGSISLWPPALTHPGVCPEHPTAARLDWDLGNEEAKSNTSHCCWLSLTWNGQYDLRTGYPNHFTCRRSGCCVWSVNSGIWKSHVSSHLSVHSRFGLNNSIGVKVQCVSQVSPLHEFFSFAWIQHRQTLSKCSWTCCCCFLHQHNIKENIKTMTHSTLNRFTSVFFASILLSSSRAILSGHATGWQVQTFRHTSQRGIPGRLSWSSDMRTWRVITCARTNTSPRFLSAQTEFPMGLRVTSSRLYVELPGSRWGNISRREWKETQEGERHKKQHEKEEDVGKMKRRCETGGPETKANVTKWKMWSLCSKNDSYHHLWQSHRCAAQPGWKQKGTK